MIDETASAPNFVLLLFRLVLALVFIAHGWNHVFGGGKIEGTGRWFDSLGMRPGLLHAWLASLTEIGAGVLVGLGLLTPLGAAAMLGVMVVALITNHMRNGFFIFRPGEGYEYVLVLATCAVVIGGLGGGGWSVDRGLGIFGGGWGQLILTAAAGIGGAAVQLIVFWRPGKPQNAESKA
ncbi:DoxX family protein [Dactylosporangium roseum]|uniref:DoxX family protein n=1 Tax=Dactylosporangium roseum TaxID=47989 RepID=A0ABY5ZC17_9ACTN|nr:DoxX family protein [Dactylosporangium roseum]UWZ39199.1 DoxX family protein [Dactylosporangium roseum]